MTRLKYFICYYFLLCIGLFSCAQSRPVIKNVYATCREVLPGNIAVDPNGNEIASRDTINFIYIETSSGKIQWEMAWKNNKTYTIIPTLIKTNPFDAGTNMITNETVKINIENGNKLWELRLASSEKKVRNPVKMLPGEIVVQGTYRNRKFLQKISNQIELSSIPSQ